MREPDATEEGRNFRWETTAFRRGAMLVLILISIALVGHEIFGAHGWQALRWERAQYNRLKTQIEQLQQQRLELEREIEGLKSDPKAIEQIARDKMHLARPNEVIFTLPDPPAKPHNPSSAENTPQPKR